MAFFGYDPFRGVSNLGSTIEQAGQQIGGMISSIPRIQQQEQMYEQQQRLGAQQERMGELGIQSRELEVQKQQEVHEQIKKNPSEVANIGKAFANDLRENLSQLPEKLQNQYGSFVDRFEKSYQSYENMGQLSDAQAEQARTKIIQDFEKTNQFLRLMRGVSGEGAESAKTREDLMQFMAKEYPEFSAQQLKGTSLYESLPGKPKAIDPLTQQKIETEKARQSKLLAEIDKLNSSLRGKSDKDSKFLAQELDKLRTAEEKANKDIADIDTRISEKQTLIDRFDSGEMVLDPKTRQPLSDAYYQQSVRDIENLEKRKEELVKGKELRQQSFMEIVPEGTKFGIQPKRKVTAVEQVGNYPTEWTFESAPVEKSRQRTMEKVKRKYGSLISEAASNHGVDEDLIVAIIGQESSGKPNAVSSKKAQGLMQVMPSHFIDRKIPKSKWKDPKTNINLGAELLKGWLDQFGTVEKAVAAYNAGPGNVSNERWKTFKETTDYIPIVRGQLEYLKSLKPEEQVTTTPPPVEDAPKVSLPGENRTETPDTTQTAYLSPSQAATRVRDAYNAASTQEEKQAILKRAKLIQDPAFQLELEDLYQGGRLDPASRRARDVEKLVNKWRSQ